MLTFYNSFCVFKEKKETTLNTWENLKLACDLLKAYVIFTIKVILLKEDIARIHLAYSYLHENCFFGFCIDDVLAFGLYKILSCAINLLVITS